MGKYFQDAGEAPPAPSYTLQTLPDKELWTGVVFNGNKVGFSRLKIEPLPDGLYRLESETSIRLRLLGFDKRIVLRSSDVVRDDLSVVSFSYDHVTDGSEMKLSGEAGERELRVTIATNRSTSVQRLPLAGRIYPAAALDLYPVLAGLAVGKEHTLNVYNGEVQRLFEAVQRVEAWEKSTLFEGPAFKVVTEMLGLTSTSWIDTRGRPVLELGLNGVLISALEDERTARGYLAAAALNQDDVLVDWSLVKLQSPIPGARNIKRLSIALAAGGRKKPVSDARQNCRPAESEWICDIDVDEGDSATEPSAAKYLRSSIPVPSVASAITRLAREVAPQSISPEARIGAILAWIGANIRKEAADVFTALDVLETGRAECQGHAYLYAALARASGIPTRVMNGLVYSEDHAGFLYHAWAESLVAGRWRAVDPTFGQPLADATHIALVEGEEPADLLPLTEWVGNTRIRVLEAAR